MDGSLIFVLLLSLYIAILIGTGWYFNRRQRSLRDFLLAGRRAGALSLGFSAAASWLTAGALLAVIGFFMLLGMGSIWGFVAPNILALLLLALLVGKVKSIPAMTQPELLEIRYGRLLRTPVALIIIVVMILFAVADIKGLAMVLQVFYGIGQTQAALLVGLSVAAYVTLGGLSAVIATDVIQFLCLGVFILIMSLLVVDSAGGTSELGFGELAGAVGGDWWNPLSIGLPMVLIFTLAIIPGWVSEQDPWQKIWAAKSEKAARLAMVVGALLVAMVFAGCAVIALGLQVLYPETVKLGFPMGMAKAEPALLAYIMTQGYSDLTVALCAIALAAAAMSCTDTFAASGASCIARDLYQRHLNPGASMPEMLLVNRLSVLLIIGCATLGSFFITSIIEAIHIATFIASASYFFVLIGGMYWRRGTTAGAVASMAVGFCSQVGFILFDLKMTVAGAPPHLESLHPLFMGHGVIVAMVASGLVYVAVSLLTRPSPVARLAPFFADQARLLVAMAPQHSPVAASKGGWQESRAGDRVHLRLSVELPEGTTWRQVTRALAVTHRHWLALSGHDSLRRCTRPDILSCVSLCRGDRLGNAWLEAEGQVAELSQLRGELSAAEGELLATCGELSRVESGGALLQDAGR